MLSVFNGKNIVSMRTVNLNRDESSLQFCKNLHLIAKEWHQELSAILVIAYRGENYADKGWYCGDNNIMNDCSKRIKDIPLTEFDNICRTASEEQGHYSVLLRF